MRYVTIALYSLFLTAIYQLVAIPLVLDFSYYGFAVLIIGALLGYFCVPKPQRRFVFLLSLLILLLSYGVQRIYLDSLAWRFIEFPFLFLLLGALAAWYGKIRWRDFTVVFLALTLFLQWMPFSSLAFYSQFQLVYNSAALDRFPTFPVYPIVNRGTDLYTLGDLKPLTDDELKKATVGPDGKGNLLAVFELQKRLLEGVDILRFSQKDGYLKHPATKEEVAALPFPSLALTGFPYYISSWTVNNEAVRQHFTPSVDPKRVLTSFFNPLSITAAMDKQAEDALSATRKNWSDAFGRSNSPAIPNGALVGKGKFMPGNDSQLVVVKNNEVQLIDGNNPSETPIAAYKGSWDEPVTSNLVIGDVDGDGIDELLLNTIPARILKLNANRTWNTIWESGTDSLRFEFVQPGVKAGSKPMIVTNDPSLVRDKPDRYLTGYTWQNGQLIRDWRVFKTNLLFPFPIDNQTWASGFYGTPNLFVIRPLPVSLQTVLAGMYALLIVGGFGYQLLKRGRLHE